MRGLLLLLVAMGVVTSAAGAQLTDSQQTRYYNLTAELRCLICQNRTIAESDAPLAKDLRAIVARDIAAGKSDAEIKQYLVDRYGEWVLYDPPFQPATLILWLGPFALLLIGLTIVAALMMRRRDDSTASHAPLDRDRLARVLDADESLAARDVPTTAPANKDR